jgi:hypothetical protein
MTERCELADYNPPKAVAGLRRMNCKKSKGKAMGMICAFTSYE